jgi:hypothetical protein
VHFFICLTKFTDIVFALGLYRVNLHINDVKGVLIEAVQLIKLLNVDSILLLQVFGFILKVASVSIPIQLNLLETGGPQAILLSD